MAKIENGKVAIYSGAHPMNMASASGVIFKKPKEEITAAEVAAIPDDTYDSMVKSGDIKLADKNQKPKPAVKAEEKEGDK